MARTLISSGPWKGVRDTIDPYDDPADPGFLQDATNGYFPDGEGMSGFYSRPGWIHAAPSYAAASTPPGTQMGCAYTMTALDGTLYRFFAFNAKLYRLSGTGFTTSTDVTPVGVAIDASATPASRIYMTQLGNSLIVSDGVNKPWIGTNLGATPITAAYIDIGAGGAWSVQGAPVVYQGSLFCIARTVPGGSAVTAGLGLVWSEPNQPATGYTQTNYANFWNLIEQSSQPIYALAATNNTLYYFRAQSIGAVQGTPGSNFVSTATRDLVSANVGCTAPASIVQFLDNIFFVDRLGRPYLFVPGAAPVELWKSLRGQIDANPTYLQYPLATALVGVGCLVPQLNVVLLAGWSSNPTNNSSNSPLGPSMLYCFDAKTGVYQGRWNFTTYTGGPSTFDVLAQMSDWNSAPSVVSFCNQGISQHLNILGVTNFSGQQPWMDSYVSTEEVLPQITVKTQRLGYSATKLWNAQDVGSIITQNPNTLTVGITTPYTSTEIDCTSQMQNATHDGTNRTTFGMDVRTARGIQLTVTPTAVSEVRATESGDLRVTEDGSPRILDGAAGSNTSQFVIQNVSFPATQSTATAGDQ